ncbi:MAG: NnrS family protein [Terriglobales bacterium]
MPDLWAAAAARERAGVPVGADPLPERRAARLLAAFIAVGLFFLALPGTFMGVGNLLLIAADRLPGAPKPAWIQAHGQAQVFGWVGSFILGISFYILPKFRGLPLRPLALAWGTWALWTVGVALRWLAGIATLPPRWMVVSAVFELVAFALSQYLLIVVPGRAARERGTKEKPLDLASILGIAGFAGLGLTLLVNLGGALAAPTGTAAYPKVWDGMWVELALWIFILPVAVGYSTRFVTQFLGLRPPHSGASRAAGRPGQRTVAIALAGLIALAATALAREFLAASILGLLLAIAGAWALRIFEPSGRAPKVNGVYRHYPAFIRIAYGWLLVGAALGVAASFFPALPGMEGASRHAVTVGFIATLIFSIGPRILPAFLSSRELFSRKIMAATLWLLTAGCLLRVVTETLAYGSPAGWAWQWLPVSAYLELAAVLLFVINLGLTLAQRPPAWFRLESVNGDIPLYWCVASYPRTRKLLRQWGLSTLGRVRDIPRTLTLAEAAAADGVDAEELARRLRGFFTSRQPRRHGG